MRRSGQVGSTPELRRSRTCRSERRRAGRGRAGMSAADGAPPHNAIRPATPMRFAGRASQGSHARPHDSDGPWLLGLTCGGPCGQRGCRPRAETHGVDGRDTELIHCSCSAGGVVGLQPRRAIDTRHAPGCKPSKRNCSGRPNLFLSLISRIAGRLRPAIEKLAGLTVSSSWPSAGVALSTRSLSAFASLNALFFSSIVSSIVASSSPYAGARARSE